MARQYADWEKCDLNMSGIPTGALRPAELGQKTGTPAQRKGRQEYVACNRCGTEPPTIHRARLYGEIKAATDLTKEQRRMSAQWRKATGR